jgi:hypothetical protein
VSPSQIASSIVDNLKSQPFVLALLVINVIVLAGFAYTLHEVSKSIERRDGILQSSVERSRP